MGLHNTLYLFLVIIHRFISFKLIMLIMFCLYINLGINQEFKESQDRCKILMVELDQYKLNIK